MLFNKILVLTDFTVASQNAIAVACEQARNWQAALHILNIFPGMASNGELQLIKQHLKEQIVKYTCPAVSVSYHVRHGAPDDVIKTFITEHEPDLIVLGNRLDRDVFDSLFGSFTTAVLESTVLPVLIIPEMVSDMDVHNVLLAYDLHKVDNEMTIPQIQHLTNYFKAQLHVVNVLQPAPLKANKTHKDTPIEFENLDIKYVQVEDRNLRNALNIYIKNHGIDLLIMIARHHSFLHQLLYRPTVDKLLEKLRTPLLRLTD